MTCAEPGCNEIAEQEGDLFSLDSFTSAGKGAVWFMWYRCLAGHKYMTEVFEDVE